MRLFVATLCLLGLAACGMDSEVVSETPKNVTIHIDDDLDALSDATREAQEACGKHARAASFQNVADVDGEKVAIFNCVK